MERESGDRTEDLLVGHVEWVRALARRLASGGALRCSFEVRVAAATNPAPDSFTLQDAAGERLPILRIEPGSVNSSSHQSLAGGRTGILSRARARARRCCCATDRCCARCRSDRGPATRT